MVGLPNKGSLLNIERYYGKTIAPVNGLKITIAWLSRFLLKRFYRKQLKNYDQRDLMKAQLKTCNAAEIYVCKT